MEKQLNRRPVSFDKSIKKLIGPDLKLTKAIKEQIKKKAELLAHANGRDDFSKRDIENAINSWRNEIEPRQAYDEYVAEIREQESTDPQRIKLKEISGTQILNYQDFMNKGEMLESPFRRWQYLKREGIKRGVRVRSKDARNKRTYRVKGISSDCQVILVGFSSKRLPRRYEVVRER